MKARYPGKCLACHKAIRPGQEVTKEGDFTGAGWVHVDCERKPARRLNTCLDANRPRKRSGFPTRKKGQIPFDQWPELPD